MQSNSTSRSEWIDFLRGISALAILLFHVRVDLWAGWGVIQTNPQSLTIFDKAISYLSIPMPFMGSAVMLFFLISGFCVHYPYAAKSRKLDLKLYSIRRFFRIYPPYLAAVLISVLCEFLARNLGQITSSLPKIVQTITMTQNYSLDKGQMVSNPSLWSLPVEMELYAFYPIFYLLLSKLGWKTSIYIITVISLTSINLIVLGNTYISGNFLQYWVIWCLGALLAEKYRKEQLPFWSENYSYLTALLFLIAISAQIVKLPLSIQHLTWSLAYFMIILWGLTRINPLQNLHQYIKQKIMFVGQISYSIYLIHFPFFKLIGLTWVFAFGSKPLNLLFPIFFSILCIPVGYAFYNLFEKPSHVFAKHINNSK